MNRYLTRLLFGNFLLCLALSAHAQKGSNTLGESSKSTASNAFSDVKRSKLSKQGDKLYDAEEYFLAAQSYQDALNKSNSDVYAAYMLGKARMAYFDYKGAQQAFKRVNELNGQSPPYELAGFWYANLLKVNGQYEQSAKVFKEFIAGFSPNAANPEHEGKLDQAKLELEGCELALNEFNKPFRQYNFRLLAPPLNSEAADFSPIIFRNDSSLVITSSRRNTNTRGVDQRFGQVFTNNYRFEKNKEGRWEELVLDDDFEKLNTNYNDVSGVFNEKKTKFYYASCQINDMCQLFVSRYEGGKWVSGEILNENINMPGYYSKQPAISSSGDTLFFVSDRPGGKGMSDIWYAVKSGDGEDWGTPINLSVVNTPYIDMSPCYYKNDGVLFFASNGRSGFGGLDIYMARLDNFSNIKNAGLPFNSNRDDFYFVISDEVGYLSSNREGGVGNDDIYAFRPYSTSSTLATVKMDSINNYRSVRITGALFSDSTKQPLPSMKVTIRDMNDVPIKSTTTNPQGQFRFDNLPTDVGYKVGVSEEIALNKRMAEAGDFVFAYDDRGHLMVDAEGNPIVRPKRPSPERIDEEFHTPDASPKGTRIKRLPGEENMTDDEVIAARMRKKPKGVGTDSENLDDFNIASIDDPTGQRKRKRPGSAGDGDDEYGEYMDEFNISNIKDKRTTVGRPSDVVMKNFKVDGSNDDPSRVFFENIYFDFDRADLRPEAKKTLDELVVYLKANANVQVEIGANTDEIGSSEYNKKLSARRGATAKQYILKSGIDETQIVITPHGEDNALASNKNVIGRQLNRRVEFYIIGGANYSPEFMAYVTTPGVTLSEVAEKFGMSADELKKANALSSDNVNAYVPLRVRRTGDANIVAPVTMMAAGKPMSGGAQVGRLSAPVPLNAGEQYHTVKQDENLYRISLRYGMSVKQIKELNKKSSNLILVGEQLKVLASN